MVPTRIYVRALLALHRAGLLKAAAHITGGGLPGNLPRVLPDGTVAVLEPYWSVPPVFPWLARTGGVAPERDAAGVQLRYRHGDRGRRCRCRDAVAAGPGGERGSDRRIEAGTGPASGGAIAGRLAGSSGAARAAPRPVLRADLSASGARYGLRMRLSPA